MGKRAGIFRARYSQVVSHFHRCFKEGKRDVNGSEPEGEKCVEEKCVMRLEKS